MANEDELINLTDAQYNQAARYLAEELGLDPDTAPLGKYCSEIRHIVGILKSIAKVLSDDDEDSSE